MFSRRIGILLPGADVFKDKPAFKISAARATAALELGQIRYLDDYRAQLKSNNPRDIQELRGGTMRDSWKIKYSGGYGVWQMPKASKTA